MSVISLVVGLVLDRITDVFERLRGFGWLARYTAWIGQKCLDMGQGGTGSVLIAIGLPVIVVALALGLLGGGLLGFLAGVFVLLLCLGPVDMGRRVQAYVDAGARNDADAERAAAQAIIGSDSVPADSVARTREVVRAVFGQSNPRLFAVVFWFAVLGPVGAVIYRLADLYTKPGHTLTAGAGSNGFASFADDFNRAAKRLKDLLDWVPVRLVAIGFALTGSFERALPALRGMLKGGLDGLGERHASLLSDAGSLAIALDEVDLKSQAQAQLAVERASALVFRTLIAFVVALLALQLLMFLA